MIEVSTAAPPHRPLIVWFERLAFPIAPSVKRLFVLKCPNAMR
jgi:hypothetical protein